MLTFCKFNMAVYITFYLKWWFYFLYIFFLFLDISIRYMPGDCNFHVYACQSLILAFRNVKKAIKRQLKQILVFVCVYFSLD